jgi:hypothetical protein
MLNALISVSNALIEITQFLGQKAGQIYRVYLIGPYLAPLLYDIAIKTLGMANRVHDFKNGLEDFYYWVRDNVQSNPLLNTLLWYARALIDFISNPYPTVVNIVRSAFNYLDWMYYHAYEFVYPHAIRILDTYFPQWRDVWGFLVGRIGELFQDFNTLRFDPVRWVLDRLRQYSYNVSRFLSDPDGYIIERVKVFFPDLQRFLFSPADYIIEKLSEKLESFADRNMARILKIAENILSAIF